MNSPPCLFVCLFPLACAPARGTTWYARCASVDPNSADAGDDGGAADGVYHTEYTGSGRVAQSARRVTINAAVVGELCPELLLGGLAGISVGRFAMSLAEDDKSHW
jgi:hypothetical protein